MSLSFGIGNFVDEIRKVDAYKRDRKLSKLYIIYN